MHRQGQFIATLLDSSSKALAAGAVTRLVESGPESGDQAQGFTELVADTQVRLRSLAEALAAGRPELLRQEIEWLALTYRMRGVPLEGLGRGLRCLADELTESLPKEPAKMACAYLENALEALRDTPTELPTLLVEGGLHVELARAFLLAALEGRRSDGVRLLLDALDAGVPLADLHQHVLGLVQAEMGRLWQVGEVHAAEEHLGSRMVEEALSQLRNRLPRVQPNGRCVLVASVRGNLHDIGARMVADQFELAGWRSLFFGADTPTEDFVASITHFEADLVALSAGQGLNIRAMAELVAAVRAARPDVPVLVGGRPFALLPDLWKTVGAHGSASDGVGAVREAQRLLAE